MRRPPLAFLLVFVLLCVGLGLAGWVYYTHQRTQLRTSKLHELAGVAELKVREIEQWRKERIGDGLMATRNPLVARAVRAWFAKPSDAALREQMEVWIRRLRDAGGTWAVMLLDPAGKVRLSSPEGMGVEPHVLAHALRASRAGAPVLSDFHHAGPEGKIVLSLFTPFPDPDDPAGPPVGILVVKYDPAQFLYPFVQLWPTPSPSAETLLVERAGDQTLYLNELRHRKGTALTLRRPLADQSLPASRAVVERSGVVEGRDYRGVPVLSAFRPVPGTPWVLLAKVDASEIYAPLAQDALLLGGAVAALALGAAALLLFLAGGQAVRTERRGLEALRESEERFRATYENAPVGIEMLDLEGRFLRGNRKLGEMLGYTEDELRGLTFTEITHPEDREAERLLLSRLLAGEDESYTIEKRYLRKGGATLWVRVTSSIARTSPPHRISVIEDISTRKAAEDALRETEERFRTMVEALPLLAWMARPDGWITWYNRRWYEYTGTTPEEMEGWGWQSVHDPQTLPAVMERWKASIATGEPFEMVFPLRRADGVFRSFLTRVVPLRGERGRVVQWFGTNTDVTDQVEAAEALARARDAAEAANRAKSDFLANMSHEIRTPMAGVMGMTDLVLDTELAPAQRQYLEMVKSSAEALLTVINDVLDFSKIEAGRLELDSVEFGLRELVEKAAEALAVRAHEKHLELVASVDPDLAERHVGDPGRLRQVLLNLLGNAVKFTERGEVVVTVRKSPEPASRPGCCRLRFSVRDTGIGIPEERQPELFEAFTQLDTSIARTYGGTGLGLTISKRVVDAMGGRLWVDSPAPAEPGRRHEYGPGSVFSFEVELPVAEADEPCEVAPPADLAGRRALVLDDNATNLAFVTRALTSRGMDVVQASRAREGAEVLVAAARAGRSFDIALLDVHLPDGDGFSVVEEVRRELPVWELAVMMITSDDVPGAARRCRELGVGDYLVKPVRLSMLLSSVASVLGAKLRAPAEVPPAPRTLPAPELPQGLRVLVAEDNPVNRTFAEALLTKAHASVTSVPDGGDALRALEEGEFDVVLMDVQMPGIDGYEATRQLRARGVRTPVIGLTAHAMRGDRERCLAAGMDDYLTKPVTPEALYRKLAAWGKGCPGVCPGEQGEPPADLDKLRRGLGNDPSVLLALTAQLRATRDELLPEIERALREGEPARLQAAAHKLRGGLLVFEAKEAVAAAEELERLGREGGTEGADGLAGELRTAVGRLLGYLEERTEGGGQAGPVGLPRPR